DLLELRADLVEQRGLDDAGGPRRGVAVVRENVPSAKDDVVERRERDHVADPGRASLGTLAKTNGPHLRERTDRFRDPFAYGENTGDCGRADRAETNEQHAKLAACRSDINWSRHELTIISRSCFRC